MPGANLPPSSVPWRSSAQILTENLTFSVKWEWSFNFSSRSHTEYQTTQGARSLISSAQQKFSTVPPAHERYQLSVFVPVLVTVELRTLPLSSCGSLKEPKYWCALSSVSKPYFSSDFLRYCFPLHQSWPTGPPRLYLWNERPGNAQRSIDILGISNRSWTSLRSFPWLKDMPPT